MPIRRRNRMKENFTSINVIIDASGSMHNLTNDTIGSFNSFLKEQKAVPSEAAFTLCTFNTNYNLVHDFAKLGAVPNLSPETYAPSGGTALLDAVGTTIDSVGKKLSAMPESERPSKVIFLIITDGQENSSREYSASTIKNMVEHQKNVYNWEFVFMGANIDAIAAGANLGVDVRNTMNYAATPIGTRNLYKSVSENMKSYRSATPAKVDFFNQPEATSVESSSQPVAIESTATTPTRK